MTMKRDWALLTLAAAGGEPVSPVQLQKALFLLGRELAPLVGDDFYEFHPYNYGPFDLAVYWDAEVLQAEGLVSIERPTGARYNEYRATPAGLAAAERLRVSVPGPALKYLEQAVAWTRSLSFADLVRAIYEKYPDTRANSVFAG